MKKIIITIILILSTNVSAQTIITDTYFKDKVINWDSSGSPYIIQSRLNLSSSTLNINNAEIIFEEGSISFFSNSFLNMNKVNMSGTSKTYSLALFNSKAIIKDTNINVKSFIEGYSSDIYIDNLKSINSNNEKLISLYSKSSLSLINSYIENYKGVVMHVFNADILNVKNNEFVKNKNIIDLYYANKANINQNDFDANDISIVSYMYNFDNSNINIEDNYFQKDFKQIYLYEKDSDINETNRLIGPFKINIFSKYKNINNKPCCSNILFLPGIMASRLYVDELTQNQLWEPNRNTDVKKLFLNSLGQSLYNIYTKDIIGITNIFFSNKYINQNVYNDFFAYLKSLKTDKYINDYKLIPYDWRMSADNVLQNNSVNIIKSIKDLQKTSKTGKVTIISHSNGGIITKVLVKELEKQNLQDLIDNVVFVAVPEYGTPQAVTSLLYGHNQSILKGLILKSSIAHDLGINMPTAYNLLPSEKYFQNKNIDKNKIENAMFSDEKFNQLLFNKSKDLHEYIDDIIYPKNINIYQILGTGLNTVYDISYDKGKINPLYDKNGDGVVQDLQSLRYGTTTYIDLNNTSYKHFNIMNNKDVISNIDKIIKPKNTNTFIGLDYDKIIKNNDYKLLKITNNVNPFDLDMNIDSNILHIDKNNIVEVKEGVNNRFELFDESINYLYKDDFNNLEIDSNNDNEIDISIIESVDGKIIQNNYNDIPIFKDNIVNLNIDDANTLRMNLPNTNQIIKYQNNEVKNIILNKDENIDLIIKDIKDSNMDYFMKNKYIRRIEAYKKSKDSTYLFALKTNINKAISSINSLSHSAALKARYSRLKESYIYLNILLLKL